MTHDVQPGKIQFHKPSYEFNQTDMEVVVKVVRSVNCSGKVRVPWRAIVEDDQFSPYLEIGGHETFKSGEEESHIKIKIPQVRTADFYWLKRLLSVFKS